MFFLLLFTQYTQEDIPGGPNGCSGRDCCPEMQNIKTKNCEYILRKTARDNDNKENVFWEKIAKDNDNKESIFWGKNSQGQNRI